MPQAALDDKGGRTCFVIMPYGVRDVGSTKIDFDRVYQNVLMPAIRRVRVNGKALIPKRADKALESRVLIITMVQDLLRSRLAVAEVTTANENVSWELGMRHNAVSSGTVLLWLKRRAEDRELPFDIRLVGVHEYTDTPAAAIEKSIAAIAAILRATLRAQQVDSPAFLRAQSLADLIGSPESPTPLGQVVADAELSRLNGRPLEAATLYSEAVALAPDNLLLHQRQGALYMQAGAKDLARQSFDQVLIRDPTNVDARRYIADLRLGKTFHIPTSDPAKPSLLDGLITAQRPVAASSMLAQGTLGSLVNVSIQTAGLGRGQHYWLVRVIGDSTQSMSDTIAQVSQICERHGFASRLGAIDIPEVNGTVYAFGAASASKSALESAVGGLREELRGVSAVGTIDVGGKLGGSGSGSEGGGFGSL